MNRPRIITATLTAIESLAGKIARVSFTRGAGGDFPEDFANRQQAQHFGLASVAPLGTQLFAIKIGTIVLTIGSAPGAKKPALNAGESAVYNDFNERLKLIEGLAELTGDEIKLGANAVNKIIDARLIDFYNLHTHSTTSAGAPTGTPILQINEGVVATTKTKAE